MIFVVRSAESGEVYDINVPNEETLILNIHEDDETWVKGNPDAPEHITFSEVE